MNHRNVRQERELDGVFVNSQWSFVRVLRFDVYGSNSKSVSWDHSKKVCASFCVDWSGLTERV